jgi:hypothetical protein
MSKFGQKNNTTMKNYKNPIRLIVLSVLLISTGCGVFSLHPLYQNKDLLVNADLIGTWQIEGDKDFLIIDTIQNKKYGFKIVDEEDTVSFEMGLIKLDDQYFIDLFPSEDDYGSLEYFARNYVPAHTFMKFDYIDDEIYLTEFDNERLIELFQQNRIRLAHEQPGEDEDYVVITASTADLQKFIARYANDKDAFNETEKYRRL